MSHLRLMISYTNLLPMFLEVDLALVSLRLIDASCYCDVYWCYSWFIWLYLTPFSYSCCFASSWFLPVLIYWIHLASISLRVCIISGSKLIVWLQMKAVLTINNLSCSLSYLALSRFICNFRFSLEITLMVLMSADSWGAYCVMKFYRLSLLIFKLILKSSVSYLLKNSYLSRFLILSINSSADSWL